MDDSRKEEVMIVLDSDDLMHMRQIQAVYKISISEQIQSLISKYLDKEYGLADDKLFSDKAVSESRSRIQFSKNLISDSRKKMK